MMTGILAGWHISPFGFTVQKHPYDLIFAAPLHLHWGPLNSLRYPVCLHLLRYFPPDTHWSFISLCHSHSIIHLLPPSLTPSHPFAYPLSLLLRLSYSPFLFLSLPFPCHSVSHLLFLSPIYHLFLSLSLCCSPSFSITHLFSYLLYHHSVSSLSHYNTIFIAPIYY